MLVNKEDADSLETIAVEGVGESLRDLWSFRVDVSVKKTNPQLLSSVFHSGEPILIDNVEKHIFQLNEASQNLVRQLGTKGFIIVPIRTEKLKWGVIVSDKIANGNERALSKNDVRLLQRVAQTLALALDQEKRVEEQRILRNLFERYVPSDIISKSLKNRNTETLGGTQRTVTAMFFDIRDFTAATQHMAPQSTVNFVNRVFSVVEEEVRKSGGRIDKFLGDGLLAVWGSLSETEDGDAGLAVSAAMALISRWPEVNLSLVASGLPEVHYGMGLHLGPALVGHVGGEARCEFTCMGATINLASRIEGSCKNHNAILAISDECFVRSGASKMGKNWCSEYVKLKGLSELCLIHFWKSECRNR
jgi:class 3 adenylate cyclase